MDGSQAGSALIGGSSQKNKSQMSSHQKSGNIQNNSRRDKSQEDGGGHSGAGSSRMVGDKSPIRSASNFQLDPAQSHLNASIESAIANSGMLCNCLDTIIKSFKGAGNQSKDFEVGEIIGIVKLTVCQIVILESPAFGSKEQDIQLSKEQNLQPAQKDLVAKYKESLKKIPDAYTQRYKEYTDYPNTLIKLLINELIEDCTFVLDIDILPDEKEFKDIKDQMKKAKDEMSSQPEPMADDKTNLMDGGVKKDGGQQLITYSYSQDLIWKYEMLQKVLETYNEPMLNLHFMSPYLKNNSSSINSYDLIFQLIWVIPGKYRTQLLDNLRADIEDYKKKLMKDNAENIVKILPQFHIIIYMLLNFEFDESEDVFQALSLASQDLRLMPLPYGLLPHELVEILDNERILPGISQLYKLGEDFPLLNHFNFQDIANSDIQNVHQRALLFGVSNEKGGSNSSLIKMIKEYKSKPNSNDQLLTSNDFNSIRYSYVRHMFEYYGQSSEPFGQHLSKVESWYIWNLYKQLSSDILEKSAEMKYSEIESNFKQHIMEKLRDHVHEKIIVDKNSTVNNQDFRREIHFQVVSDIKQIQNSGNEVGRESAASMEFGAGAAGEGEGAGSNGNVDSYSSQPATRALIESFISAQVEDKQHVPPIRILVVGDDKQFNKFVAQYVGLLDLYQSPNDKSTNQANEKPSGYKIDRSKIDLRVFLVPQNENTLAHYLAMYDDLYCQNVYNFFNCNTLLALSSSSGQGGKKQDTKDFPSMVEQLMAECKAQSQGDLAKALHANLAAQMIDRSIQSYMKDAIRNVEIKIFKAVLHLADGKQRPYYFTNRFELGYTKSKGNSSVYDKLAAIRNIVNASSLSNCQEAYDAQPKEGFIDGITQLKNEGGKGSGAADKSKGSKPGDVKGSGRGIRLSESTKAFKDCIQCKLSVKRMDYLGQEHAGDSLPDSMEAHLSHLKLINVPTMFDIGCTQADPQSSSLTLCMVDSITHKAVKQQLAKNQRREAADIEKLRQHMQAIHTNMQVSSMKIEFDSGSPLQIGGPNSSNDYSLTIDGIAVHQSSEALVINEISVSRLLLGPDGRTQASVPVMTYLPLKDGELKNQHIQQNK